MIGTTLRCINWSSCSN